MRGRRIVWRDRHGLSFAVITEDGEFVSGRGFGRWWRPGHRFSLRGADGYRVVTDRQPLARGEYGIQMLAMVRLEVYWHDSAGSVIREEVVALRPRLDRGDVTGRLERAVGLFVSNPTPQGSTARSG